MKKLLVLVLLVPILALTMISCDADMRSNIVRLMGGINGNVYEGAGFIVANTAQAEAVAAAVATIGTGAGGSETVVPETTQLTGLGVEVAIPSGVITILAPQGSDDQKTLNDDLADAFNSDAQKKKLLEDLKKPVTDANQKAAAIGTTKVFNATLTALVGELADSPEIQDALMGLEIPDPGDGSGLTQGDMLALQLMTNLISNTVETLKTIGGAGDLDGLGDADFDTPENKEHLLNIIAEALTTADFTKQISGTTSIDFSGQFDLESLLENGLGKGIDPHGIPLYEIGGTVQLASGLIDFHDYGLTDLYSDRG